MTGRLNYIFRDKGLAKPVSLLLIIVQFKNIFIIYEIIHRKERFLHLQISHNNLSPNRRFFKEGSKNSITLYIYFFINMNFSL